jgi:hypothetical protein
VVTVKPVGLAVAVRTAATTEAAQPAKVTMAVTVITARHRLPAVAEGPDLAE